MSKGTFSNAMKLLNELTPVIEAEGYTKAEVMAALTMITAHYTKGDFPDDTDIREVSKGCGVSEFYPEDFGLLG